MSDLAKVNTELAELESRLEKLRRQKMLLESAEREMSPAQKLAVGLHDALCRRNHDALCRWNHTDGCSWHYEIDKNGVRNWNGRAHSSWLGKARKFRAVRCVGDLPIPIVIDIVKSLKDL